MKALPFWNTFMYPKGFRWTPFENHLARFCKDSAVSCICFEFSGKDCPENSKGIFGRCCWFLIISIALRYKIYVHLTAWLEKRLLQYGNAIQSSVVSIIACRNPWLFKQFFLEKLAVVPDFICTGNPVCTSTLAKNCKGPVIRGEFDPDCKLLPLYMFKNLRCCFLLPEHLLNHCFCSG